jgi:plasmid replication initiation protein
MAVKKEQKLLVEMSVAVNTMHNGYETLREQRILLTYLSKINARNPETRSIRLSLDEFASICELKDIVKYPTDFKPITDRMLQKLVSLRTPRGGYDTFVMFTECKIDKDDDDGEWYFEISAHERSMPYFFELKRYVSYDLKYPMRLQSLHHIRIYSLLKQYESAGIYRVSIDELHGLLNISDKEYQQYKYFSKNILKPAQKAITEKTDISFTFAPCKRSGRGGRISELEFIITSKPSAMPSDEPQKPSKKSKSDIEQETSRGEYDEEYDYDDPMCVYDSLCPGLKQYFKLAQRREIVNLVKQFTPMVVGDDDRELTVGNQLNDEFLSFLSDRDRKQNERDPVRNDYRYFISKLESKKQDFLKESNRLALTGAYQRKPSFDLSNAVDEDLEAALRGELG